MSSQEFITWLKGFTEGVHEYNITPKQWDLLKEKLKEVDTSLAPYKITLNTDQHPFWYSTVIPEDKTLLND
jgi:hypothetical protein